MLYTSEYEFGNSSKLATTEFIKQLCILYCSSEYRVDDPPRVILNKLEKLGYQMIAMGGVGQTAIWTLYCESPKNPLLA